MDALRIFEHNRTDFEKNPLGYLPDLSALKITRRINEEWSLYMEYPANGHQAELIKANRIICFRGQGFRIESTGCRMSGSRIIEVNARHVFFDTEKLHFPAVKAYIGKTPLSVLKSAFSGTKFTVTDSCGAIDTDYRIDLFPQDKLNAFELIKAVIDAAGFGEIYMDNYKIGLVPRLGGDSGVVLDTSRELSELSVSCDFSDTVTRLYPYGANDLDITSVNGGDAFIESDNIAAYGAREGFADFSDYTSAAELRERAMWEFDPENENRIDVPAVSVSCETALVFREGRDFSIGDTVRVRDKASGTDLKLRITAYEDYPLSPDKSRITIGRIRSSLFSYLKQFDMLTSRYKKISASNGSVMTGKLTGIINTGKNPVKSSTGYLSVDDDLMTITDKNGKTRAELGNLDGKFLFNLYNGGGEKAVSIDSDGDAVFAGKISSESVFSGSIDTEKNVSVGQELKIHSVNGSGGRSGIFFYTPSGKLVGDILMISGSNDSAYMVIEAEQILVNNTDFDKLVSRVEALERAGA